MTDQEPPNDDILDPQLPIDENTQLVDPDKIASGIHEFDSLTGGLSSGELVLLASRPCMGKTDLLLSLVEQIAIVQHKEAVFLSPGMPLDEILPRFLAMHAKFNWRRILEGKIQAKEWRKLRKAVRDVAESNIYFDDQRWAGLREFAEGLTNIVTDQNSKIVVIDSFEHLCDGFAENDHEETCAAIKALAQELDVPIVVSALLTTQMHEDGTNTPTMEGLAALDPLASLADVILFLHSEDYYHAGDPTYEQTGLYDLIIAKQSRGATGVVPLIFLRDISRFNSSSSLMPPE